MITLVPYKELIRMPVPKQYRPKRGGIAKKTVICSHCKTCDNERVRRSPFVRSITFWLDVKCFRCYKCIRTFYKVNLLSFKFPRFYFDQITGISILDKNKIYCPHCGQYDVERIKRPSLVKRLFFILPIKHFICYKCIRTFYKVNFKLVN